MPYGIVRDADGLYEPLLIELFHGAPGACVAHRWAPVRRAHLTWPSQLDLSRCRAENQRKSTKIDVFFALFGLQLHQILRAAPRFRGHPVLGPGQWIT